MKIFAFSGVQNEWCIFIIKTNYPFGRSVLATTYQMASVHLRFAKQNNAELKPK